MYWHDGALSADSLTRFDLRDRGLLLGDGVFDTALVLRGVMVWRAAHLGRLAQACETLGFGLDLAAADGAIDALLSGGVSGVLRMTVTRGVGQRGLASPEVAAPTIFAALTPLRSPFFAPLSLHLSAVRRNETAPTAKLKSLNYLDAILAAREAVAAGFDDALFLNTRGDVACATIGNVVALDGRTLVTPPLGDGVVAGIARRTILRLGPSLGLESVERSLTLAALKTADAVFVTNSLKLLAPVTRVGADEARLAPALIEDLTRALRAAVRDDCGTDPGDVRPSAP